MGGAGDEGVDLFGRRIRHPRGRRRCRRRHPRRGARLMAKAVKDASPGTGRKRRRESRPRQARLPPGSAPDPLRGRHAPSTSPTSRSQSSPKADSYAPPRSLSSCSSEERSFAISSHCSHRSRSTRHRGPMRASSTLAPGRPDADGVFVCSHVPCGLGRSEADDRD